jgi:pyruvate kinase
VFDVANAVLDNTDAVMLSAETASGDHPHLVIEAMSRIRSAAERMPRTQVSKHRVECQFEKVDEAIAMSAMYAANHLDRLKAIITLTESGSTPLLMSRIRSAIPIFALTRNPIALRKMCLYRGIYPLAFDVLKSSQAEVNKQVICLLKAHGIATDDDYVLMTSGDIVGEHGHTNTMKIYRVGDM